MLKALNFQLSWFSYIHQVSVFYINVKTKLVQTFVTLVTLVDMVFFFRCISSSEGFSKIVICV